MDFYTGVPKDRGEEMGLEQEGATDPSECRIGRAQQIRRKQDLLRPTCSRPIFSPRSLRSSVKKIRLCALLYDRYQDFPAN